MSYFDRLSFASGYYHIDMDGRITLKDNMPHDMKVRFWKTWREFRKKIIENEKAGIYSSAYPTIPIEDEDPNAWQYEDWLDKEE